MAIKFPKSEKYNFTRNLVKRHKLVPHLEQYLSTEIQKFCFAYTPKEKDDAWHPSGHCTPSPTDLYAFAAGPQEEKEWGSAMLKTFMVGHFWHALLQHAVVDLGFAAPEAIERRGFRTWGDLDSVVDNPESGAVIAAGKVRPYHWATGSGDVAPLVLPSGDQFVLDFKTMSSHQFKTNGLPEWAAGKYEAQINIYLDWFDMDRGLILAINKDTPHDMKEFEFERNQPLIDTIYDKWEFVSECLDAGEAPTELDNDMFEMDDLFQGPIAQ